MANETLFKKSLVLAFVEGVDEDGKDIVKRYSYSNIKILATPQSLLEAAQAMASLSAGSIHEFTTVATNDLN